MRIVNQTLSSTNKKSRDKLRFSNFLITLNTNTRLTHEEAEEQVPVFNRAINEVLGTNEKMEKFVEFRQGGPEDVLWDDSEMITRPEIGNNKRGSRFHYHIALKFAHYANIRIKIYDLRDAINEKLAEDGAALTIQNAHIRIFRLEVNQYLKI